MAKKNIENDLVKIKEKLFGEKKEKLKQIEENKNKYDKTINKTEDIEQKIIDKNSQFNNFQKNLNKYDEYENNTIINFKKLYDNNSKKEIENNNKFYDFQKFLPQKEKELKDINDNIDIINKNKIKNFEEQEKIKKQIHGYENKSKIIQNKNKIYNQQLNNLQDKISLLTLNLNNLHNNDSPKINDKNNDINSIISSFDISNSNYNNVENDLLVFKNNFNLELNKEQKSQLLKNKTKLLDIEKKENVSLKERKKLINNEIFQFKINQSKNSSNNNNQYNLVKIEENINKISEKEIIIKNYQTSLNTNYNLLNNYINKNESHNNNNKNEKENENDISIGQFRNIFTKFIEKAKEIDEEFEIIKKEFKESGTEYKLTSKEIINTSLRNNPLLKNYEEIHKNNEENNNQHKKEEKSKRITMNDNKILNDAKNLQIYNRIYNRIYPKKRKLNDYLEEVPEYKRSLKKENDINRYLNYQFDNEASYNKLSNKDLSIFNSNSNKENKRNIISKTTNMKAQLNKRNEKNTKFFLKSPNKTVNKGSNNIYKINENINNESSINKFNKRKNKNSKTNLFNSFMK